MPRPDAPRTRHPHFLDVAAPLPTHTYALHVVVSIGRSDERVHGRVDAATPDGTILIGTIRCGVRVWRSIMLPGIEALATAQKLPLTVREVENGPPAHASLHRPSPE